MTSVLLPYLRRGLALWPAARFAVAIVALIAEQSVDAAVLTFAKPGASAPAAILVVAALGAADLHVRNERALLGNLGLRRRVAVAVMTCAAAGAELALSGAARLV